MGVPSGTPGAAGGKFDQAKHKRRGKRKAKRK